VSAWAAVLAGYAAVVATASLGWQILSYWLRERVRVTLDLYLDADFRPDATPDGPEEIRVKIINNGSSPIEVVNAALEGQGEPHRIYTEWGLPLKIEPRSRHIVGWLSEETSHRLSSDKPVRAWVTLGDDKVFRTPWTSLRF
jgi:hypothetical protein